MENQYFMYMGEEDGDLIDLVDGELYYARDGGGGGGEELEPDEYDMLTKVTDTSASQARKGKDIQGIPWERLSITREGYRLSRLEQYRNYENIPSSGDVAVKECKHADKGANYYDFFHNTRLVKPTILHFQLRNLVWATSKHDVYLMSNYSVMHWSPLSEKLSEVLNFSGHVAPTERHPGSLLEGFMQTQVSTLAVRDNILIAGGFQGELTCKCLDKPGVSYCTRTTYEDNAITNAIEIYDSLSNGVRFMVSNNDSSVREYDMERFQLLNHFRFPCIHQGALTTSFLPSSEIILKGCLWIPVMGRLLVQLWVTMTSRLRQHGTQTGSHLPQEIKIELAEFGILETCLSQLQSSREIWVRSGPSVSHRTASFWLRPSLLISSMCIILNQITVKSKKLTFLGRFLV